MDNRPIGIFDSGLGGLTTVRELKRLLPHENIVYFGDTSRVPYGTRSRDTVRRYSRQDMRFLLSKQVKMVIAACNTASASLLDRDISTLPAPFVGAILPAAIAAQRATKNGKIAVIGTNATIRSRAYETAIHQLDPRLSVTGTACSLFVPLVENGFAFHEHGRTIIRMVAEEYLAPVLQSGADTLILGCTHYPILKQIIGEAVGPEVLLIDSGREAARTAKEVLISNGLCSGSTKVGQCSYYVSDSAGDFSESAACILGEAPDGCAGQIDIEAYGPGAEEEETNNEKGCMDQHQGDSADRR